MTKQHHVAAIIPALNEEAAIASVLQNLPYDCVTSVIVVDNGSTDATAAIAAAHGAIVVHEPQRGYGAACLRGIAEAQRREADIIVFLDADGADHPDDIALVLRPIIDGSADLVIGSRARGTRERGSLTIPQRFGNWLATWLIRLLWRTRFTDLGPLRAIPSTALANLHMQDRTYGWTVEMQIKAAQQGLRCHEIPVRYRRRVGTSKISGTVRGTIMAGVIILSTIARYAFRR
jgi:glycosyltransferase involved in cell wall biosynthesis